jgi:hypothetical protein
VKIEAARVCSKDYTMAQPYIEALNKLNEALKPFELEACKILPIRWGIDRWSKFLTTGEERDLEAQVGYIRFSRKISDELDLEFGAYFPRFDYAVSQSKTLYVMKNGKRVFDGMRGKGCDESPIGWLLSAEEMAVFEKWYQDVSLRETNPTVLVPPIKNECL